ncbi:ABC transporter ATP-binding protein [Streptosporangium sp. NPDC023963]|uniref:ABC transporter ATP-binding protein n=1 Tax=Streptosporangium sp. NPDC023963 TaxID=3155608 RepID=UPI003415A7DB
MSLDTHDVTWGADGVPIVDGVTISVPEGRFTGLIGPNGSGKSTLLRLLAGLLRPRSGTVLLDGRRLDELPRREVARRLAVVAQEVSTDIDMTVADVVALGRIPHRSPLTLMGRDDLRDARETEEALERCGLAGWGERRWSTLSGGERRRVGIARALAQRPTELLLDEPTNHLDIHHQLDLLRMLSRTPATVVAALHDLNLAARYCDHLLLLEAGRVVASGPPAEVLTERWIERVYRVRVTVSPSPDGRPLLWYSPLDETASPPPGTDRREAGR